MRHDDAIRDRPLPKILGTLAIMGAPVLVLLSVQYLRFPGDGWGGAVATLFCSTDTEYSGGYDERASEAVRIGMDEAEVTQLLGVPLQTDSSETRPDGKFLRFSRSPGDTHYRHRLVVLERGRVVEVVSEFYVD